MAGGANEGHVRPRPALPPPPSRTAGTGVSGLAGVFCCGGFDSAMYVDCTADEAVCASGRAGCDQAIASVLADLFGGRGLGGGAVNGGGVVLDPEPCPDLLARPNRWRIVIS